MRAWFACCLGPVCVWLMALAGCGVPEPIDPVLGIRPPIGLSDCGLYSDLGSASLILKGADGHRIKVFWTQHPALNRALSTHLRTPRGTFLWRELDEPLRDHMLNAFWVICLGPADSQIDEHLRPLPGGGPEERAVLAVLATAAARIDPGESSDVDRWHWWNRLREERVRRRMGCAAIARGIIKKAESRDLSMDAQAYEMAKQWLGEAVPDYALHPTAGAQGSPGGLHP